MKRSDGTPGWVVYDDKTGEPGAWFATRAEARQIVRAIGCGRVDREVA
jgi:hypothetical protein